VRASPWRSPTKPANPARSGTARPLLQPRERLVDPLRPHHLDVGHDPVLRAEVPHLARFPRAGQHRGDEHGRGGERRAQGQDAFSVSHQSSLLGSENGKGPAPGRCAGRGPSGSWVSRTGWSRRRAEGRGGGQAKGPRSRALCREGACGGRCRVVRRAGLPARVGHAWTAKVSVTAVPSSGMSASATSIMWLRHAGGSFPVLDKEF
jgi:hypothetical protein